MPWVSRFSVRGHDQDARRLNADADRQHKLIVAALGPPPEPPGHGHKGPVPHYCLFRRDGNHYIVLSRDLPDWDAAFGRRPTLLDPEKPPTLSEYRPPSLPVGTRVVFSVRAFAATRRAGGKVARVIADDRLLIAKLAAKGKAHGLDFDLDSCRIATRGDIRLGRMEPTLERVAALLPDEVLLSAAPEHQRMKAQSVAKVQAASSSPAGLPFGDLVGTGVVTDEAALANCMFPFGFCRHTTWGFGLLTARPLA